MANCFFVSDLHGQRDRYRKLFRLIVAESPAAVFLGGDLLPSGVRQATAIDSGHRDFVAEVLIADFKRIREELGDYYPEVFLILGNDDSRRSEAAILDGAAQKLWKYMHNHRAEFGEYQVYGYSYVPPSPFQLKDWERYDVSRFVDPGSVSPEEGYRTVPTSEREIKFATIQEDLEKLAAADDLHQSIWLFHTPPYNTKLDRAPLDGKMVDHAPLDVHVGSIAVRRFIEEQQPLVTLHGHVHESAQLTGGWRDRIGRTQLFSAAHHGSELALVRFDPRDLEHAKRQLV
ncbi:MAG: metallophosphoesterase [bacterium]